MAGNKLKLLDYEVSDPKPARRLNSSIDNNPKYSDLYRYSPSQDVFGDLYVRPQPTQSAPNPIIEDEEDILILNDNSNIKPHKGVSKAATKAVDRAKSISKSKTSKASKPSDWEVKAFKYFRDKGLGDIQSAAIVGNLRAESGGNPDIKNLEGSGATGLQQWLGPRLKKLNEVYGENPTFDQQLEYLWNESSGNYPGLGWNFRNKGKHIDKVGYYQYGRQEFLDAGDLETAVIAWNQGFGRPGKHELANDKRVQYARNLLESILKSLKGGVLKRQDGGSIVEDKNFFLKDWLEGRKEILGLNYIDYKRPISRLWTDASEYGDDEINRLFKILNDTKEFENTPEKIRFPSAYDNDKAINVLRENVKQSYPRGSGEKYVEASRLFNDVLQILKYKQKGAYYPYSDMIIYENPEEDNVIIHERTHALHAHPLRKEILNTMKRLNILNEGVERSDYYDNNNEVYSRLMLFRFDNKLDPKKKWNQDEILNLRNDENVKDYNILKRYNNEFIERLFNNVASTLSSPLILKGLDGIRINGAYSDENGDIGLLGSIPEITILGNKNHYLAKKWNRDNPQSTSERPRRAYVDESGNLSYSQNSNVSAGFLSGVDPIALLVVEGTVLGKPLSWLGKKAVNTGARLLAKNGNLRARNYLIGKLFNESSISNPSYNKPNINILEGEYYRVGGKDMLKDAVESGVVKAPNAVEIPKTSGINLNVGTRNGGVPYFTKESIYIPPSKDQIVLVGNQSSTPFKRIGPKGRLDKYNEFNSDIPSGRSSTPFINDQYNQAQTNNFSAYMNDPEFGWTRHLLISPNRVVESQSFNMSNFINKSKTRYMNLSNNVGEKFVYNPKDYLSIDGVNTNFRDVIKKSINDINEAFPIKKKRKRTNATTDTWEMTNPELIQRVRDLLNAPTTRSVKDPHVREFKVNKKVNDHPIIYDLKNPYALSVNPNLSSTEVTNNLVRLLAHSILDKFNLNPNNIKSEILGNVDIKAGAFEPLMADVLRFKTINKIPPSGFTQKLLIQAANDPRILSRFNTSDKNVIMDILKLLPVTAGVAASQIE